MTWQFDVRAYFEHEELWKCVKVTEEDAGKNIKAKLKLILLVKPNNFNHIRNFTTAKEIWDKLQEAFQDSGLYTGQSHPGSLSCNYTIH